jgi:rRNA-processing protein FCF1
MARLSDPEPFESLRGGNVDHTEDALIAATAEYEDATLVTEDRRLRGRAIKQGIDVIGWSELRDRLHDA